MVIYRLHVALPLTALESHLTNNKVALYQRCINIAVFGLYVGVGSRIFDDSHINSGGSILYLHFFV